MDMKLGQTFIITQKLEQVFTNQYLRKILKLYSLVVVSNNDLCTADREEPVEIQITNRKWHCVGYTNYERIKMQLRIRQ